MLGVDGTFRTIPTVENLRGGSFRSRPNPYSRIPVKLISNMQAPDYTVILTIYIKPSVCALDQPLRKRVGMSDREDP